VKSFTAAGVAGTLAFVLCAGCSAPLLGVKIRPKNPPDESCNGSANSKCDLPGIPFYPVRYQCVHNTQWLEPVFFVTLTITSVDKAKLSDPLVATKLLNIDDLFGPNPAVRDLFGEIRKEFATDTYDRLLERFRALPERPIFVSDNDLKNFAGDPARFVLASNSIVAERYVDSATVYYYNGTRPWAGSATVSIDLNSDGSMGKASATAESKTAETLLGLLPISDIIKKAVGVGAGLVKAEKPPKPYALQLQIESKVYKIEKRSRMAQVPPCPGVSGYAGQAGETIESYSFTEVTVGAAPPPKADTKPATDKPTDK
jgi:hypothetical protein